MANHYYHYPPPDQQTSRLNIPSSDPAEDLEDPTIFPRIGSWLQDLDQGPRGSDGHEFTQFAANFTDRGYVRIFQLADKDTMTVATIMDICPGIKDGTAALILKYAWVDVARVRKNESHRLREIQLQPKRYI